MANAIYPEGWDAILTGSINLTSDTIKIVAVDAGYTYSAAHDFLADVGAATRVATVTLSGITVEAGVVDGDDEVFGTVTGDTIVALIGYKDTGNEATSPLIWFQDTTSSGAISAIPNGTDITLTHDNGANKIFSVA